MFKLRIFLILCTKWAHFKFDACYRSQNIWVGACLPWCRISSSFKQFEDVWASRLWVSGVLVLQFEPNLAWYKFAVAKVQRTRHDFQQECQIWTRLTIEHVSTWKESILNEPWPTRHNAFWTMFTYGFLFAWKSFSWHMQMVWLCLPTVVSGSIPGPFSNVNDRIMPVSDAVSSEGPKSTGIQQRSSALSLTHRYFPVSLKLLMMLCTVDDEICKAFAIWCWDIPFIANRVTDLMSINWISC